MFYFGNYREITNPCNVIFMQGLQGSGKSTYSNLTNAENVDQDMFYGHSPSCQGWLEYMINNPNGPENIIVSRCNANYKHYNKYLEMIYPSPANIYFISPKKMDYQSIITSIVGVIERSKNGDMLMVGRNEYDIDTVIDIIIKTFNNFKFNEKSIRFNLYQDIEADIYEQMENAVKQGKQQIKDYITNNFNTIISYRRPIDTIVSDLNTIISKIKNNEYLDMIVYNQRPTYVGLFLSNDTKEYLNNFIFDNLIEDITGNACKVLTTL